MKRSQFTHYRYAESLIYEFRKNYFVIERCQQGVELNPAHGSEQGPSEDCALSASLSLGCSAKDLGQALLKAIENFDTHPPAFNPWEDKEHQKALCDWMGVRGIPTLEKNSRLIQVVKDYGADIYTIYPYDNCNINPWNGPFAGHEIVLPGSSGPTEIGEAVIKAFAISTYHPERKDTIL